MGGSAQEVKEKEHTDHGNSNSRKFVLLLGVGPSMFALSKLKEGITGCTDCMACGSQRMNCRDPKNLHQVEFESIALEFTRDVSVQTPLHVYTQEAVVKVISQLYIRTSHSSCSSHSHSRST